MACSIIVKQTVIALNTTRTDLLVHFPFSKHLSPFASRMNAEGNVSMPHNTGSQEFNTPTAAS